MNLFKTKPKTELEKLEEQYSSYSGTARRTWRNSLEIISKRRKLNVLEQQDLDNLNKLL